MSRHNPDYSIYITQQANIPGRERPGWMPFLIEAVDESDDDHAHIGFWGPDNLLENLAEPTRLTAWISEAILADSSEDWSGNWSLLISALENSAKQTQVRLGTSDNPGQLLFSWQVTGSLQAMAAQAAHERRQIALDQSLPTSRPAAPGPRF